MKLPSLQALTLAAGATLRRFPSAILSALAATVVALIMVDHMSDDNLKRALAACIMGLPLFVASGTAAERYQLAAGRRWMIDLGIAAGLFGLYALSLAWTDELTSLRFAQLLLAAHLAAAVAAYLAAHTLNGFWQFNRFLLLRWLLAGIYAAVLWAGLSIALLALQKLFGLHVPGESYARLWVIFTFTFHPWFFLAGIPKDLAGLDSLDDYPKGLKVFTQMVLMPLVTVYLTILTAYLVKILVTRVWPSGWIGYLVSSVSAAGVLALLLVHPIRTREDSRWVNVYGRWFFIVLLPSLGILLVAIGRRIGQYGITEPRYFLLVLALWLTVLAVYYAITASQNIKLIPVTLGIVAFLTALGPWGAYAVSRRSQEARFTRILTEHGLSANPLKTVATSTVSFSDRRELSAALRYLDQVHGDASVARLFGIDPAELRQKADRQEYRYDDTTARAAMQRLGLAYVERWSQPSPDADGTRRFSLETSGPPTEEVAGFDAMRNISYPGLGWVGLGPDSVRLTGDTAKGIVSVQRGDSTLVTLDVPPRILEAVTQDSTEGPQGGRILHAPLVVEASAGGLRVRLMIRGASGEVKNGAVALSTWYGTVLVAGIAPHR